jgi:hypothetical protein
MRRQVAGCQSWRRGGRRRNGSAVRCTEGTCAGVPSELLCSDDVLDALVCALVARAVEAGQALPIDEAVPMAPRALEAAR